MNELNLKEFKEFWMRRYTSYYNWENNMFYFKLHFKTQLELSKFNSELIKCHDDMKIIHKNTTFRVLISNLVQNQENLLEIEGNGFILKTAKW